MVKNSLTRQMELSGNWSSCQSGSRDRYLLEKSIYNPGDKSIQNVLKVEIGVKDSLLAEQTL